MMSETNALLAAEVKAPKAEVARLQEKDVELNGTSETTKRRVETLEAR